jgi:hypothetical protein
MRAMETLTSQASSHCFKFDIADAKDITNLKFYTNGGNNILVIYAKQQDVYLSVSRNYGESFDRSQKVMELSGEIVDVQMLMKNEQFVIAIQERTSGVHHKRTISGWINDENQSFSYKLCPKQEIKGELLNVSLSFRELAPGRYESVDHLFYRNKDDICVESMGHPCKIPVDKP